MIYKLLLWVFVLVFLAAAPSRADNVQFTGQAAFDDPATGISMSPYSGLLNGQAVQYFCVDFSTGVSSTASWTATATILSPSSSFANTLQYQKMQSSSAAELNYLEMAWLITQLESAIAANSLNTAAEDEWAIWSFTGGLNPYNTNAQLLSEAQLAVQNGFTAANMEILTPAQGQIGQELMVVVATPEPSSFLLAFAGAMTLFGLYKFRRRYTFC